MEPRLIDQVESNPAGYREVGQARDHIGLGQSCLPTEPSAVDDRFPGKELAELCGELDRAWGCPLVQNQPGRPELREAPCVSLGRHCSSSRGLT